MSSDAAQTASVDLLKWRFQCLVCDTVFDAFGDQYDPDGMERDPWSARTPSGKLAMAIPKADPVWEQIDRRIYDAVRTARLSVFGREVVGGFVLSRFLDPSPCGEQYKPGRPPPCPLGHGTDQVGSVGPGEPPETRTHTVALLRHTRWDTLTDPERDAVIASAIAEFRELEPGFRERARARSERLEAQALRLRGLAEGTE